jgi:glycosyltransferase involved in cell wall biosynthesis
MQVEAASNQHQLSELNSLSVIIPVYNQEKNIASALAGIKGVLDSTMLRYELVIVNDGSRDNTLDILRNEEESDPHIRIISYSHNMGKGHAVKMGIMQSHGDSIIFTDGDLDISPEIIMEYVRELETCDLVIASKRHPLSNVTAPVSRKILSRLFNVIVRLFTGIKMKDTQSGLKAGNGGVLRKIFKIMLVKRYAFDVELLVIASILGMRIKEMPVDITIDRKFKLKEIVKMFIDVLAISYRSHITKWYQKRIMMEANDSSRQIRN